MNKADLSDPKELEVFNKFQAVWMSQTDGPRVGDFVMMPNGEYRRFTHDWGKDIQTTTCGNCFGASFCVHGGYADFSGGLDPAILKSKLVETGEVKPGRFWYFSRGEVGAHRGVWCELTCRVYRYEDADWKCGAENYGYESEKAAAVQRHKEAAENLANV